MDGRIEPDWDTLREIINRYLASSGRKPVQLAEQASIPKSALSKFLNRRQVSLLPPTVIKLYLCMCETIPQVDRRTFLEAAGLWTLALVLARDWPLLKDALGVRGKPIGPERLASNLQLLAHDIAQHSWVEALPLFREAERVAGCGSSNAAKAACSAAQLLINLGDYDSARDEVSRIVQTYEADLDRQTQCELHRLNGWLDYYLGDFPASERAFKNCLRIADETGIPVLAESAQHFLGRVYGDWAQTCGDEKRARILQREAERRFDSAYRIHSEWGAEGSMAFDLFRKAQLLQRHYRWREARALRKRAREMFGRELAVLHIDLEEARWALYEDADIKPVRLKTEMALQVWSENSYAKGMADALRILGTAECMEGSPDRAVELYIAALCVYPYENRAENRELWTRIAELRRDAFKQRRGWRFEEFLRRIEDSAEARTGRFSCLESVIAARSADIDRILKRLRSEPSR